MQERSKRRRVDLWAAALGIGLINQTARWSARGRARLGRVLGELGWRLVGSRRRGTVAHLKGCFPGLGDAAREQLGRRVFHNLTGATVDHSVLWKGRQEDVER